MQVKLSDEEHRDLMKFTKAAGFESYADYVRHLISKDAGTIPVHLSQDPIRHENRHAHKRLEALLNRLTDDEREQLGRILDAAFPAAKGKQAS